MNWDASGLRNDAAVGIIGAGTMGAGIAQIAAAAGHRVLLFDARSGAAAQALDKLNAALKKRVDAGKLDSTDAKALLARIKPADAIAAVSEAGIVIEAIVERLDAKRELLTQLESLVADRTILASNTSSISVTALGRDLRLPQRLVGMHFFNPVPVMKLVEVVSGAATDSAVANAVADLAVRWGKVPIHARSTPGFVVNRIARPFYAEALLLLQDQYATPSQIDAALRAAGFRMGPCELMDLIGHDVNFSVTESMFAASFFDRRYTPSIVQRELVDGGLLGRKTGRGFHDYPGEPLAEAAATPAQVDTDSPCVSVCGGSFTIATLGAELSGEGWEVEYADPTGASPGQADNVLPKDTLRVGDTLVCVTDGRPAALLAVQSGRRHLAVIDIILSEDAGPVCVAFAPGCGEQQRAVVRNLLETAGRRPIEIDDAPGMVVARTIAMLVNEAADAVQQGVCDEASVDTAMKLGTNYPLGPFEWLDKLGAPIVCNLLDHLDALYRGERYRASLLLRRRIWGQAMGTES
ncbi:3-hydroxyacyl-CoA dehydrogenase [Paraburkholderia sp. USG1]|uniref:3-hydroxyacyl-CoA dehydrogenase n=1 Tax=Paraburkholderia sp. USG1 TaxID=2952268 RepID=UPI002861EFC0|nr:3-hydroxyacyl-CoA dehydrogenase [Paraburkholderia sp. USG1]MDR8398400.1 3-hydroxyacyl-CoA dehydrogenase [Paraburkholderia sp. USG1]